MELSMPAIPCMMYGHDALILIVIIFYFLFNISLWIDTKNWSSHIYTFVIINKKKDLGF